MQLINVNDVYVHRCGERLKGCKGRIHLSSSCKSVVDESQADPSFHTHGPDPSRCNAKHLMAKVKISAASSRDS